MAGIAVAGEAIAAASPWSFTATDLTVHVYWRPLQTTQQIAAHRQGGRDGDSEASS